MPTTTQARTIEPNTDHPATYSAEVLPFIAGAMAQLAATGDTLWGAPRALDLFGGDGLKFHALGDAHDVETWATELEAEWAANHPRNLVADATRLPFADESFDLVTTSPCYGNRMADDHDAKDPCKTCEGNPGRATTSEDWCPVCKGTGLSRRNTYKHRLGKPLTKGTAANLRFVPGRRGNRYRRLHERAWAEVHRVLRPYAPFVLNVSNHLETVDGRVVEHRAVEWHLATALRLGFRLEAIHPIATRRQRQGANGDTRPDHEFVLVFRKA